MNLHTPLRLGLTGGIGSGKSTVAQMLVARGCHLIDADALARSMTQAHGAAIPAIAQTFGPEFLTTDGALNRDRMRAHAFTHPQAKQQLEGIIHPLVAQAAEQEAQNGVQRGATALVFDIPLLVESGRWRQRLDRVWVVDCDVDTQIERVMARSALPREVVEKIIQAQATRSQRLKAADAVIFNDHIGLDTLQSQVSALPLSG